MSHDPKKLALENQRYERQRPILERLDRDIEKAHADQHVRLEKAPSEQESATNDFLAAKARFRAAADKELKEIDRDFPELEPWNPDR